MSDYLPILVMLVLGIGFAFGSFVAATFLAPRRPNAAKLAPYECGIVPEVELPERFPVRFYLVAMIFIVFDIELVFLYPFAMVFRRMEVFGLVEMGLFLLAVLVAYAYILSSGAIDWGPARRLRAGLVEPVLRSSTGSGAVAPAHDKGKAA